MFERRLRVHLYEKNKSQGGRARQNAWVSILQEDLNIRRVYAQIPAAEMRLDGPVPLNGTLNRAEEKSPQNPIEKLARALKKWIG